MSKVFFISLAVAVVFVAYFGISSAADCQFIVRKESEGVLNWLGNVTFTVPRTAVNWTMNGIFDQPFTGVGGWIVWTQTQGELGFVQFTGRDEHANLTQGQEFSFRFRINYGRDIPQPLLTSLRYQDIELCQ